VLAQHHPVVGGPVKESHAATVISSTKVNVMEHLDSGHQKKLALKVPRNSNKQDFTTGGFFIFIFFISVF